MMQEALLGVNVGLLVATRGTVRVGMPKRKNPHAVALGRKGGKAGGPKGGKARWEGVSAEERSAIARKAARARWAKKKKHSPHNA